MRPLLALLSHQLFSDDQDKVMKPAIAVELFHNYTLVHDDIMDNAPLRRGNATVHEKWSSNVAILAGDVMQIKSNELMMQVDDEILRDVLVLFNKTATEICEGQQFDMEFEKRDTVSVEEYIDMIRMKTAVLLGFSLELGGMIAGADKKNLKLLYDYGVNMGIGFQLMDDLLDVYADMSKFGKTVGGDIIVNSKNKKAVEVNKQAQVKADHVIVTGGLGKSSKRNIDAEVQTGIAPTADPWESLAAPPKGPTLDATDYKTVVGKNDTYTWNPGTYKELKFDKTEQVTMKPGVYYVDGGGFELKGDATLNASGVMIYNTGKRGFKVTTKGNVTISPPTSGAYKGISLFQDPTKKSKVEFSKQNHLDISGIVYAPRSEVKFKKSDVDITGGDDDDDWELEDDEPMEEDGEASEVNSISAAIVAGKLSIDKKTSLAIMGTDISAYRPILGVVE